MPKKKSVSERNEEAKGAKWSELHPVALLLRDDQIDFLNMIQRQTTSSRRDLGKHPDKETITKNTYIRCLIDILQERKSDLDLKDVLNEKDLLSRLKEIL